MAEDGLHGDQPVYGFGAFRLSRQARQLCLGATPVRLGGRALDLLFVLVERAGEVVSRAELERLIWPNSIVEDSCLRVHIGALRKALGDGAGEQRYIANVPGRGYSFVAPVVNLRAGGHGQDTSVPEPAPGPERGAHGGGALPLRMTGILGRDDVLGQLRSLLPRSRLVTIVGHGGIGKTTLAVCLAADLKDSYADGVCFVDLAPLSSGGQVPDALAAALGVAVEGESVLLTLERRLAPRRMLVVLDNCEHVIDAATALVERLLRIAPGIAIVATSREPLDAEGEWIHRLAPLACPPDDPALGLDDALAYPALRLLAERARAGMDTYQLGQADLAAAVKLCRRVDGVPLALEFAAARVGLLGMHGVVEQLNDRLRLLGSGRRTVLPRHRTLRALLDWSYELLPPPEQRVLRCCAVFGGPFSLESAIAVVGAELEGAEVARCVLSLVSKSLLGADTRGPDASFALLGITRAYAIDRLDDDPERGRVARRHAHHTLALLQACEEAWETLDRSCWLARASHLIGNLRSALDWAFGPDGDPAFGTRLAATATVLMSGVVSEAEMCRHATRALDAGAGGSALDPMDAMRLQSMLSVTALPGAGSTMSAGSTTSARRPGATPDWDLFERAFAQARASGRPAVVVEAAYTAFARCQGAGLYHAARGYAAQVVEVAQGAGLAPAALVGRRALAQALHMLGAHDQALALAREVLEVRAWKAPLRLTSPIDRGVSMRMLLGRIQWLQGDGAAAAATVRECVDLAGKDKAPVSLASALALAALPVALWRGDDDWARELAELLAHHGETHGLAYWNEWAQFYRQILVARASRANDLACAAWNADAVQGDHLATFWSALAGDATRERCEQGLVGWCMPEVLRAGGERLLAAGGAPPGPSVDTRARAEALFLRALALAREQGAAAWELRAATSLARLWWPARERGRGLLAPIVAGLQGRHDGADLRAALGLLEAP